MKALILLFSILIFYSNSYEIQNITIGEISLKSLKASKYNEYFCFLTNSSNITYSHVYLLLLEAYDFYLDIISYCYSNESSAYNCEFNLGNRYDLKKTLSGNAHYYKIPISPNNNYIIIRYHGAQNYGTLKARGAFMSFIENVAIDSDYDIKLSILIDTDNYFYTNISNTNYNYIYFNFSDASNVLEQPIYYCITADNPEINRPTTSSCDFKYVNYHEKNRTYYTVEYYYKADITSKNGNSNYVVIKYSGNSPNGILYVKSSFRDFYNPPSPAGKSLSTLAIVFISIGGVAFLGILITIIFYCRRKKSNSNSDYAPAQPAGVTSNPTIPLMQKK